MRKPRDHDCHIIFFHHTKVQKAISFLQEPLKTLVNTFKYLKIHLLAFLEIRLFKVLFWERKTGLGIVMKNCVGCRILVKKERECGKRTPPPFQTFILVIDHRKLQNLVRLSVTRSQNSLCGTPLFLLHFESIFDLDCEQKQQLGIYLESDVH